MASTFKDLPLSPWVQDQLSSLGMSKPTPIQSACIKPILDGKDVIGVARTGSGKTLAFALPMLDVLSKDSYGIFGLVLTPTRELAFQIADQFRIVGRRINSRECVVVGGRCLIKQGAELASYPHIVVATPGRLADHLENCDTFSLKKIKFLVIDEADRLLDGGFDEQLATIFKALPKKRQTLLFTATITDSLKQLQTAISSKENEPFFYQDAAVPEDEGKIVNSKLSQKFVLTPYEAKDGYLVHVVQIITDRNPRASMIIFVRTCMDCEVLSMTLNTFGFRNVGLHSNKVQRERMAALSQFKSSQVKILIATDVASRGLDIPAVEFVLNHDIPNVAKTYVHRVGRTARAGRSGTAISVVTPNDVKLVKAIEALTDVELEEMTVDDDAVAEILTQVKVTKNEQVIKLEETDFNERRNINKRKKLIAQGLDPDQVEKEKRKAKKKKLSELKKLKRKKIESE